MKIGFYVFSGTGNTRKVCRALADILEERGHTVKFGEMTCAETGFDRVVVGYPVHAFNAPAPVLKFLKSLPKDGASVYLVPVSGEALKLNTAAVVSPRRVLRRRGYDARGEFWFVMPYNIIFKHSDAMAARMWRAAEARLPSVADIIIKNEKSALKVNAPSRFVSFVLRIEHTAMPLIGRGFNVTDKCDGCGKCAKQCPMGNITMEDGRPKFGGQCTACMRCVFDCHKNAVMPSMLKGWRVNGKYDFDAAPAADGEICRFCRKSYLKYFHAAENGKEYAKKKK